MGIKKEVGSVAVVVILVCSLFSVLLFTTASAGELIFVPNDYEKIQWAVDNASSGDTIIVRDGIYPENVVVNVENLTLRSENGSVSTSVVAAINTSDVFRVTANSVTITGFTIRNATAGEGIYLSSVHHCTISENIASNNGNGIYLSSSSNNTLTGNTASNNGDGIRLDSSSNNNTISSNYAYNNSYDGIRLSSSSNNTISSNYACNNGEGIRLYSSGNNTISGNYAYNNIEGIYLRISSNNNTISSNYAYNNSNYGIRLSSSNNNTISSNYAYNNSYDGIRLASSSNNNTISSNYAYNNSYDGIRLASSSNNNAITSNYAYNNSEGIRLSSSSNNNTITSNYASNNSYYGIYLYSSSNNNTITSNYASNNSYYGIYLYSSGYNNLTGNTVTTNSYGVYIYSSSNNTIYNNYFENTNNVWDNGNNTWNITKIAGTNIIGGSWLGGNYWSDYAGDDLDEDGLGNTLLPYNSSGGIQNDGDWLPLVKSEPSIFNTAHGTYPSISGTHTGTITPSCNLNVSTLYTYPCVGTGGHTESIELYDGATLIANGTWNGYVGDWHNITITPSVTLLKGYEYRYVIETGSYPQIIHAESKDVTGGRITCSEFTDANGRTYNNWIPAIRLWAE